MELLFLAANLTKLAHGAWLPLLIGLTVFTVLITWQRGPQSVSYFLSTIELTVGAAPGRTRRRKRLFVATSRITADAAEYFDLPRDRTVVMGSRINVY